MDSNNNFQIFLIKILKIHHFYINFFLLFLYIISSLLGLLGIGKITSFLVAVTLILYLLKLIYLKLTKFTEDKLNKYMMDFDTKKNVIYALKGFGLSSFSKKNTQLFKIFPSLKKTAVDKKMFKLLIFNILFSIILEAFFIFLKTSMICIAALAINNFLFIIILCCILILNLKKIKGLY